jgi:hypothetical protein
LLSACDLDRLAPLGGVSQACGQSSIQQQAKPGKHIRTLGTEEVAKARMDEAIATGQAAALEYPMLAIEPGSGVFSVNASEKPGYGARYSSSTPRPARVSRSVLGPALAVLGSIAA